MAARRPVRQPYVDETVGNYHIYVTPVSSTSCRFTVTHDATGWQTTGSEPGPCSTAHAIARRLVMRRRAMGFEGAHKNSRKLRAFRR